MKKVILILLISLKVFSQSAELNSLKEIAKRCDPVQQSAPLYADEFKWGYGLSDLISKFFEIYKSNKRLPQKAYWSRSDNQIQLPIRKGWGASVQITPTFVQSVAGHIEKAFELQVIEGVFFPDMGHSHILIPEQHYEKNYSHFKVEEFSDKYKKFFTDSNVEFLYHTAEQLKLLDNDNKVLPDPYIQHRHATRNIVGKNQPQAELKFLQNDQSIANTAGAPPGYAYWSGGFNLSANQDGCFAYTHKNQVYYFDISLFDLEYDPDQSGVFSNF